MKVRRSNISTILETLDRVYNLDWHSSASKNECTAAVGLKWMLNQVRKLLLSKLTMLHLMFFLAMYKLMGIDTLSYVLAIPVRVSWHSARHLRG